MPVRRLAIDTFIKKSNEGDDTKPAMLRIAKLNLDFPEDLAMWSTLHNNKDRYKIVEAPRYYVSSVNNSAVAIIVYKEFLFEPGFEGAENGESLDFLD